MRCFPGFLFAVLLPLSSHGEYWYDNFDTYVAGPVSDQVGWEYRLGYAASYGGWVNASFPRSSPNALALPVVPSYASRRLAVYNQLNYTYSAGKGPIVRVSVQVYRDNTDQHFRMHLGKDDTARLTVQTDTDGTIMLGTVDSHFPFLPGEYQPLTMFYDMATNKACLTYGGVRIVGWQNVGTTAFTSFNMVWFERVRLSGITDHGDLLLDDVSVQTFPADTWAWWRFDEGAGGTAMEETSRFDWKTYRTTGGAGWETPTPCLRTLFNGEESVQNLFVQRGAGIPAVRPMLPFAGSNNWCLEMIVKLTGAGPVSLFEWGEGIPPASSAGCWIKLLWVTADNRLDVYLRDNEESGLGYWFKSPAATFAPDTQWHHIALVKAGSLLEMYIDYDLKMFHTIDSRGDGSYAFSAASRLAVGVPLHEASAYPRSGFQVDEVRYSDAAISEASFLQMAQPIITAGPSNGSSWFLRFVGHPKKTYTILQRGALSPGSWSNVTQGNGVAGYIGSEREVPLPTPASGTQRFYRLQEAD